MKAKSGGILPAERNVHKMKLGMSCYCLDGAMAKGMTVDEVIDFAAAHGCEHIEFVPFHLEFVRPQPERGAVRPCAGKMRIGGD